MWIRAILRRPFKPPQLSHSFSRSCSSPPFRLFGGVSCATTQPIETLEELKKTCPSCKNNGFYLDAATPALRCGSCDALADQSSVQPLPRITWGVAGKNDLGQGCYVDFIPNVIPPLAASQFFEGMLSEASWSQHLDAVVGLASASEEAIVTQPRLIAYQASDPADSRFVYTYPGLTEPLIPTSFTPIVSTLLDLAEKKVGTPFNSVHLNLYRSTKDHVSWHTDEDVQLYGSEPVIASVSLGEARFFALRQNADVNHWVVFALEHGSLLVMRGCAIGAANSLQKGRINLTFRGYHNR
eukprot:g1903.t1